MLADGAMPCSSEVVVLFAQTLFNSVKFLGHTLTLFMSVKFIGHLDAFHFCMVYEASSMCLTDPEKLPEQLPDSSSLGGPEAALGGPPQGSGIG